MLNHAPMASVAYFVVVVFDREDGELRPVEPLEVRSVQSARRRVALLVVAFSRTGDPATELMRAAGESGADTIVVAGRRHGVIGGIAYGSVCTHLLHRWPHSLLVVHRPSSPVGAPADKRLASGQ